MCLWPAIFALSPSVRFNYSLALGLLYAGSEIFLSVTRRSESALKLLTNLGNQDDRSSKTRSSHDLKRANPIDPVSSDANA